MSEREVKVILVPIGQPARIETMEDRLEVYQAFVGGEIEGCALPDGLYMICHGEGALIGLPMNRYIPALECWVHGPFIVCRVTSSGNTGSVREVGDLERMSAMMLTFGVIS